MTTAQRKVIVCIDGSDASWAALGWTAQNMPDAEFHLVHCALLKVLGASPAFLFTFFVVSLPPPV